MVHLDFTKVSTSSVSCPDGQTLYDTSLCKLTQVKDEGEDPAQDCQRPIAGVDRAERHGRHTQSAGQVALR